MKVLDRIPSSIPVAVMFLIFLFSPWHTVYSSPDQQETYVARTVKVNVETQMNLRLLSALQSEETIGQNPTDSSSRSLTRIKKPKDPAKALFYAVVPGIILHGSGHFYAEKYGTAAILFGSEFLGLLMGVGSAISSMGDDGGGDNLTSGAWFAVLFFGTWTYDMLAAPNAVKKYNETLLDNKNVGLQLNFKDENPALVLVWQF